jgi:tRNA nucleotidyltransferase (CCA-adding enzyme)
MKSRLDPGIQRILKRIGRIGDSLGMDTYVVGGFVRDLLLDIENLDIDIVVEGKGDTLAHRMAQDFGGTLKRFPKFGTAVVSLPNGFKIDVATARTESYEKPAALPKVKSASLRQDLRRRDFTINSMAINLNKSTLGDLIDFYEGKKDLEKKVVRVLHNRSFIDDPTRIFRAIRFEQRYNFKIGPQTRGFIKKALEEGLCKTLGDERIRNELIIILNEKKPLAAVKRMEELEVLEHIHPEIKLNRKTIKILEAITGERETYRKILCGEKVSWWLVNLLALIDNLDLNKTTQLAKRFKFKRKNFAKIITTKKIEKALLRPLAQRKKMLPSGIYRKLTGLSLESLLFMLSKTSSRRARRRIILYLATLRKMKTKITGTDLKKLDLESGLKFREILDKILEARLDGRIKTKKEEWKMAQDLTKRLRAR